MANKYYLARDDGETWGPFDSADDTIVYAVNLLMDDPDSVIEPFGSEGSSLTAWYAQMVSHGVTHSDSQYGYWLREAKRLIQSLDWIVYGVEFVVDAPEGQAQGVRNFVCDESLVHDPRNPDSLPNLG